ncbi:hypothetical protein V6N13_107836 [Hibiscus sabdariffa]|uniref:Uncharacterized protein n=1 Tax=Hibiscus sabdariffa TaxID=183260 RepID=A0ABR2SQR9_9ROSI
MVTMWNWTKVGLPTILLHKCFEISRRFVSSESDCPATKFGNDGFCNYSNITGGSNVGIGDDNGSIPESFYTNKGLKLVWKISSLIAASTRHYLLQPIIAEHKTLDSLILTDADGQGVLRMNRDQLDELRV